MSAIEDAMSQTVTTIWESIIGTEIRPADVPPTDDAREPAFVGCIHVTGPEGGVVTLECSAALAAETASAMFQIPQAQVGVSEAQDALGELTNIMGGNFKAMLSDGHHLSLPTVVEGSDFRTKFIGTLLAARVGFDCAGRYVVASFYRDGVSATSRETRRQARTVTVH
jgi:CheY-specific phosphatase CheX